MNFSLLPVVGYIAVRRYISGGVCTNSSRVDGKTIIITGANIGIGLETAKELARRGGRIILACRDPQRGQAAVSEVKKCSENNEVVFQQLDLASLVSVRSFCQRIIQSESRLDILINNAG
ncbi:MAG: SDR family NAD(P)-dependent oxidoreductase [Pseudomonadota bacterium]